MGASPPASTAAVGDVASSPLAVASEGIVAAAPPPLDALPPLLALPT
jgi:hypothetical protein